MPRAIIKLDGWYLEWSTVVQAPTSYGMTRSQMLAYLLEKGQGRDEVLERLRRTDEHGSSLITAENQSVDNLIKFNRAGFEERSLSRKELIRVYCTEQHKQKDAV